MKPDWAALTPSDRKLARRALFQGRLTDNPALNELIVKYAPELRKQALVGLAMLGPFTLFAAWVLGPRGRATSSYLPAWFWLAWWLVLAAAVVWLVVLCWKLTRLKRRAR